MDYNEDGMLDIVVGDRNGYVNYFRRTGPGVNDLTSEGHLVASVGDINTGTNSAPFLVDWNEDGLMDLILGREPTAGGSIWLYLNSGAVGAPVWTTYEAVNVGASPIAYSRSIPHVIDMNQDGKKDMIIGEDYGHIYYLENTGTNAAPVFASSVMLQAGGTPIVFPSGYTDLKPYVVDWNGDGWLDIVTGNYVNYVYLFLSYPLTSIGETVEPQLGTGFSVAGSPFTGMLGFMVDLEGPCGVEISIYSMDGRLMDRIDYGTLGAGEHLLHAESDGYPAGIYAAVARLGDTVASDRLVLLR